MKGVPIAVVLILILTPTQSRAVTPPVISEAKRDAAGVLVQTVQFGLQDAAVKIKVLLLD